jgi:hypothetical protein
MYGREAGLMEVIEANCAIYIVFCIQVYGQQPELIIVKFSVSSLW